MSNIDLAQYLVRIPIKDEHGNTVSEAEAISFKGLLALAHEDELSETETTPLVMPTADNGQTAIVRARVKTRRGTFTGLGDANPGNVNRRIAPHVLRMAETRALARALRIAVNIGEVAVEELMDDAPRRGPPPPVVPRADTHRRDAPPQRAPDERPAHAARSHVPNPEDDGREPDRRERDARQQSSPHRTHIDRFEQSMRGRDHAPTEARQGDRRAMTDQQRKLLFRLAYDLVPRENVEVKVLSALGVDRLEWATRFDASRGIDNLKAESARGQDARTPRSNGQGANGNAEGSHHA